MFDDDVAADEVSRYITGQSDTLTTTPFTRKADTMTTIATLEEAVRDFLTYIDETKQSGSIDTGIILDYATLFREYLSSETTTCFNCKRSGYDPITGCAACGWLNDEDYVGSEPLPINVITNAPAAYDYESTVLRTVNVKGHTRFRDMNSQSPFRLVALDSREDGYYAEYQQNRYKSGGYLVLTPELWDQWQDNGIIIIPEEKGDDDATPA